MPNLFVISTKRCRYEWLQQKMTPPQRVKEPPPFFTKHFTVSLRTTPSWWCVHCSLLRKVINYGIFFLNLCPVPYLNLNLTLITSSNAIVTDLNRFCCRSIVFIHLVFLCFTWWCDISSWSNGFSSKSQWFSFIQQLAIGPALLLEFKDGKKVEGHLTMTFCYWWK